MVKKKYLLNIKRGLRTPAQIQDVPSKCFLSDLSCRYWSRFSFTLDNIELQQSEVHYMYHTAQSKIIHSCFSVNIYHTENVPAKGCRSESDLYFMLYSLTFSLHRDPNFKETYKALFEVYEE
jgi:hypothetical protein